VSGEPHEHYKERKMTKIERMDAVLQGKSVDRPPMSLWYHFGNQHASGEKFAAIALDWFEHYDFDFLKLMNDYFYPMPAGLEEVKSAADLGRIERFEPESCDWNKQLTAIRIVAERLKGKAYFIDTVFDPWQSLQRSIAGEHLANLVKTAPNELKVALDVAADNLIAYCRKALSLGASGIFMSVLASESQLDRGIFLEFAKPAAMKVFRAVASLGRMNTAHIHGERIYTDDVLDFPVAIMSWEDRTAGNPSLAEMKAKWAGVVMGGIDNDHVTRVSTAFCRQNVREGLRLGGNSRFILANGCSIPTWLDPHALAAMVETAKSAGV
jgi:uroporphyrinogen decarboxylase